MHIDPTNFNIHNYLNQTFSCSCGHTHTTNLREVLIEPGAVKSLPVLLKRHEVHFPMIVCDCNTYSAAGQLIAEILDKAGIRHTLCILKSKEVVPDESALGELLFAHHPQVDCIIAVGTGTLNDLCKFFSYHLNVPYLVVATAPSMDGFASMGAALISNNLKTTYNAHVPFAIIADVDILKNAPMQMITAGLGDILGKYTCLADWKLSHIVTGEYFCPVICEMVEQSIQQVVTNAQAVLKRDPDAVAAIMEALVLTGIAMSFVGNSRPASGSEHHISHYWEMRYLFDGRKPVLHGTKVGIGTVISCYLYSQIKDLDINFTQARSTVASFDFEQWQITMHRTFLQAADGVISLERKVGKNSVTSHAARIVIIEDLWPEIIKMIASSVPTTQSVMELLSSLGAPIFPEQIGIDKQMVVDSVVVAKEVRDRYTILQLLWDLGVAEQAGNSVVNWLAAQE